MNKQEFIKDCEVKGEEMRKCSICGKSMVDGYCIEDGLEYYCDDECLHKKYTQKEYIELYEEGLAYWTEWY